jgi:hypothetical protein
MRRFACLLLCLAPALASAQMWNAESRWEFVSGGDDMGAYLAYLREYPDSPHVAEARRRLEAFENIPPARLLTPSCAATLQSRAEEMLASALSGRDAARYDARVPDGHFLASPTLVVAPRGVAADQAPIEQKVFLTLMTNRDGRCLVMQRWSHGSGLPDDCRCEPADPDFRFPSPQVNAVFADYLRFQAIDQACVARGAVSEGGAVEAFLAESISRREARAASLRGRAAAGPALSEAEQAELEDLDLAIPDLARRDFPLLLQVRQAGAVAGMTPDQLQGLCGARFTGLLAEARRGLDDIAPAPP